MATPLAAYKYKHGEGGGLSRTQGWSLLGACTGFLLLAVVVHPIMLLLGALVVGIAFFVLRGRQMLKVGPRYLTCGTQVVYFLQVTRVEISHHRGVLHLHLPGGLVWRLEKALFPTNARKADKIAINKGKKFKAISEKILAKIQRVNPGVEIREIA